MYIGFEMVSLILLIMYNSNLVPKFSYSLVNSLSVSEQFIRACFLAWEKQDILRKKYPYNCFIMIYRY